MARRLVMAWALILATSLLLILAISWALSLATSLALIPAVTLAFTLTLFVTWSKANPDPEP